MSRVPKNVQSVQKCPKWSESAQSCQTPKKFILNFFLGHPVHLKSISQGEPLKQSDWGWLSLNCIRYKAFPALSQSLFHISALSPTDFRIWLLCQIDWVGPLNGQVRCVISIGDVSIWKQPKEITSHIRALKFYRLWKVELAFLIINAESALTVFT